jgi:hypothetical protein
MSAPDPGSRYAGQPRIDVRQPDGSVRTMLAPRIAARPPIAGAYVVRAGARLDLLGAAVTGESTRWWLLADANPWADATRLETPGEIVDLPDA